jgi:SCY1-like protein 2
MNAREFQQSQFFDNILVSSIRFLDALPAKTPNEKSQFLRGLPKILEQFPKSVLDKKVLPALLEETKDRELLSLILQSVFKIVQLLPSGRRTFTDKVIPQLREIFISGGPKPGSVERDNAKEAGLGLVLENMALIGDNCSGKEFKEGKSTDFIFSTR